jgi:hypothetical protein
MTKKRGFIYVQGPGTDPAVDRVVIEEDDFRTTIVAVPDHFAAARVVAELIDGGAQRVELYDSLGPIWIGNAVMPRMPAGIS